MSVDDNNAGRGRGEVSPEDRKALRERASDIGRRLDEVRGRHVPAPDAAQRGNSLGQAMRIAVELVVGVAVGGFIGWFLDRHLGTRPWLLMVFLILGFAAGMLNVIRMARRMQAASELMQRSAPSVKDDEDDK
jgi:ATP synthase protein I